MLKAKVKPGFSGLSSAGFENLQGGKSKDIFINKKFLLCPVQTSEHLTSCQGALLAHAACCPPQFPGPLPWICFPDRQSRAHDVAKNFFFPSCRTSHLTFLNFFGFLSIHFFSRCKYIQSKTLSRLCFICCYLQTSIPSPNPPSLVVLLESCLQAQRPGRYYW